MQKLTADKKTLEKYLKSKNWLDDNESITALEKPGEGNMNFTLRVTTQERSFILKQSREYVEKYPQVKAPADRAMIEAEFYELIGTQPALAAMMPNMIDTDSENNVLLIEDLGKGSDYTFMYKKGETIDDNELMAIMDFAAALHTNLNTSTVSETIQNLKMRSLNHEHIFIYPYLDNNGLNLDKILPGLAAIAQQVKADEALKKEVGELGAIYLSQGRSLLHGDYFPGSWLKTKNGPRIIDPEFCFFGHPEFEIGVTIAHLKMADHPQELIDKALDRYTEKALLDDRLREKFTAIEILRRILGLAQLPLDIDLEGRKELVEWAVGIVCSR